MEIITRDICLLNKEISRLESYLKSSFVPNMFEQSNIIWKIEHLTKKLIKKEREREEIAYELFWND